MWVCILLLFNKINKNKNKILLKNFIVLTSRSEKKSKVDAGFRRVRTAVPYSIWYFRSKNGYAIFYCFLDSPTHLYCACGLIVFMYVQTPNFQSKCIVCSVCSLPLKCVRKVREFVDFQFRIRCTTCTQCARAGFTIMYYSIAGRYFSPQIYCGIIARSTSLQKGSFVCCAAKRHVCQPFIAMLIARFVRTSLVCGIMVVNTNAKVQARGRSETNNPQNGAQIVPNILLPRIKS